MTRVFIVEDHVVVRESLLELLDNLEGIEVAGAVGSAEEALEALDDADVDLVLADLSLPGMNGDELIAAGRERWPDLPFAALSGHKDPVWVERVLQAGGRGYILKGNYGKLEDAIRRLMEGEMYISEGLERRS